MNNQSNQRRQIFRQSAMSHYLEQREQDILPRVVAPPVFVFSWFMLALLLIIAFLAWSIEIPTYTNASGAVLAASKASSGGGSEAVIFFSTSLSAKIKKGASIEVQVGSSGPKISTVIASIDSGSLSPDQARTRYALAGAAAQTITAPSMAVLVTLDKTVPASSFAGTVVTAQLQTGSASVLSNLLG